MEQYTKKRTQQVAIPVLRERLREQAAELSGKLHHSVTRTATVELVAFTEYDEEVEKERELIERLLFLQCCRASLERAIDSGGGTLRWRWLNGETTIVTFKRDHNQMRMRIE